MSNNYFTTLKLREVRGTSWKLCLLLGSTICWSSQNAMLNRWHNLSWVKQSTIEKLVSSHISLVGSYPIVCVWSHQEAKEETCIYHLCPQTSSLALFSPFLLKPYSTVIDALSLAAVEQSGLKDFWSWDIRYFSLFNHHFQQQKFLMWKIFWQWEMSITEQVTREIVQPTSIGMLKFGWTWPWATWYKMEVWFPYQTQFRMHNSSEIIIFL